MTVESPQQTENKRLDVATDVALLVVAAVAFRLFTLYQLRPGGFVRDYSHFDVYPGITALTDYGLYPFLDFWLEWPPLIPWLMVGVHKLALLIPVWEDPRLWYALILGSVFVLFEGGNLYLLYRLGRRFWADHATVMRVLWLYALLFAPVFAMLSFFDGMTVFFLLWSLELTLSRRWYLSAGVAGVGFAIKLFPILAVAAAFRLIWHEETEKQAPKEGGSAWLEAWRWPTVWPTIKRCLAYGATFAGVASLGFLPFLLIAPEWIFAFVRATGGRVTWETVWAVMEGYYGFGALAGDRLNPAETNFAVHNNPPLPWTLISLGFASLYVALFALRADYQQPRKLVAFLGLTTTLFMLYAKGFSPQFLVFVLVFIVLLLPNAIGLAYALTLDVLNLLEQPTFFVILPQEHWLLEGIVSLRFLIFVALSLEFARLIWEPTRLGRVVRFGRGFVLGAVLISLIAFIPTSWNAYREVQLTRSPYQAPITLLNTLSEQSESQLVLTEQPLYQRVYPYLHQNYNLTLAGGDALYAGAPTPSEILSGLDSAWLWPTGEQGPRLEAAFAEAGEVVVRYRFPPFAPLTLYDLGAGAMAPASLAQNPETGIHLLAYQLETSESEVQVTLYWHNQGQPTTDYTVFTQLLDSTGAFVAGHDAQPSQGTNPVSTWASDEVVVDSHPIALPPTAPPGPYTVVVGMYDATDANNARLNFVNAAGEAWPNGAIVLETLAP